MQESSNGKVVKGSGYGGAMLSSLNSIKLLEGERVPLASFHLEGDAQQWYQILKEEGQPITRDTFKEGIHVRFGPTQFDDFFGDLTKLIQIGTVREYQCQFERWLSRAGKLTPAQQVGRIVSGLQENLRADVQSSRPTTLSAVVGLACFYEARNLSQRRIGQLETRWVAPTLATSTTPTNFPTINKLTPTEIKERRDKGLCFNYDEKLRPGHRCKQAANLS